ncbi:hypothetical protein [Rufibacter sp. XAAS-G3-1]|uniref:hypothetical protein n=1 Tax=Rufibacter sp. XAAS-G3-1 TaxID=2729134 RepID=UPI0015E7C2B2|nr:hypothetical protein [Rufibacter sp. XAAS-G3-1]
MKGKETKPVVMALSAATLLCTGWAIILTRNQYDGNSDKKKMVATARGASNGFGPVF